MRTILVTLFLTGAVAIATGTTNLDPDEQNTLTTIDTVPTKPQIDSVFGSTALQKLTAIANDPDPTADIGIRLRAIHALAKYCAATPCAANDVAHQSVASVVTSTATSHDGSQVLLLRAAIETLGAMRVTGDAPSLWPLLDHPSRDIRAATARALRDLCNNQAVTPLRARYSVEMTDQVKLAISEALRILGQCSGM
ncbi:MAG TPA: HEAT repeat domain-containing protein [Kofleriaceae bacterium]|nr:HEAT repeat domain-containing protein [Kofleriaceae bacterium]